VVDVDRKGWSGTIDYEEQCGCGMIGDMMSKKMSNIITVVE